MASISAITCIYLTIILHNDEVMQKSLANVNIRNLICNIGAGGSALVAGAAPAGGPVSSTIAAPAEKEVEAKKEESEKSDDDTGFGLFDHTFSVTCSIKS
ncbi:60S acidic ribosomal protein P1-like isoform X2 [Phoca vitulina]|uniref:60S acidic ribosomal protein P1-like isoform X2 n=1 Tax=Phoca vitulina TaxID=9720 RepID=UPI001395FE54|nr:60S acidic ribosomal protein P1-like isoform X2 [Phoca vitulina]